MRFIIIFFFRSSKVYYKYIIYKKKKVVVSVDSQKLKYASYNIDKVNNEVWTKRNKSNANYFIYKFFFEWQWFRAQLP